MIAITQAAAAAAATATNVEQLSVRLADWMVRGARPPLLLHLSHSFARSLARWFRTETGRLAAALLVNFATRATLRFLPKQEAARRRRRPKLLLLSPLLLVPNLNWSFFAACFECAQWLAAGASGGRKQPKSRGISSSSS